MKRYQEINFFQFWEEDLSVMYCFYQRGYFPYYLKKKIKVIDIVIELKALDQY